MDLDRLKALLAAKPDGASPDSAMFRLLADIHGPATFELILFACLPHTLTPAILAAAMPARLHHLLPGAFPLLSGLPFAKIQSPDRISLHDRFRQPGRSYLFEHEREDFVKASAQLAAWFYRTGDAVDVAEAIYHHLLADEPAALAQIQRTRRAQAIAGGSGALQQLCLFLSELPGLGPLPDATLGEALVAQFLLAWPSQRTDASLKILEDAQSRLERGGHWLRVAHVANRLTRHYVERLRLADAFPRSDAAEAALRRYVPADTETAIWKTEAEATTYNHRGHAYTAAEQPARALECFRRDVALSAEVHRLSGLDVDLRSLAVAYQNLGVALRQDPAQAGEAKAALEEEFRLTERLARKHPADLPLQQDLVVSYGTMADLAEEAGDLGQAEELARRSTALSESLIQLLPTHPDWKSALVLATLRLAKLLTVVDKSDEAVALLLATVTKAEELTALDPTHPEWRRNLSIAHHLLGEIHEKKLRPAEALGWFERDLALASALHDQFPQSEQYAKDYAESLQTVQRVRSALTPPRTAAD